MKNKLQQFAIYSLLLIAAVSCLTMQACKEEDSITEEAPRIFRPTGLFTKVTETSVTVTWNAMPDATSYTVEVSKDSLLFESIIDRYVVTDLTYTLDDLDGGTENGIVYSVRVRANSADMEHDSKLVHTTFTIKPENLFKGYYSRVTGLGTLSISWTPGKTVTSVRLTPSSGEAETYTISATEMSSGTKTIDNVPNDAYTVDLYNDDIRRGSMSAKMFGDVFLAGGADLSAAIAAAADNAVIVLASGATPFAASDINLPANKTVRIVGAHAEDRAVLQPSEGKNVFVLADNSNLFVENLEFDGQYPDNQSQYGINHGTAVIFGTVAFENCLIRNFGRSAVRLNHGSAYVDTVRLNRCIFRNMGSNGNYSLVQTNVAGAKMDVVEITSCTMQDVSGGVMYNAGAVAFSSFTLQNCTFYDVFVNQNQGFFRSVAAAVPATSTIEGVIVGKLKLNTGVVRLFDQGAANGAPATSSNNYKTYGKNEEDKGDCWLNSSYAMEVQEYARLSTDLWVDPENGDFHFKDVGFSGAATAGDTRWR
ncbi:MAG: fibronectin type III domain-containing protein [Prevotellaceae bacterium]|jgi:hypothetical protein|nr:fibronectin type III domain-containing protein [Prevotellaceae bacterium]